MEHQTEETPLSAAPEGDTGKKIRTSQISTTELSRSFHLWYINEYFNTFFSLEFQLSSITAEEVEGTAKTGGTTYHRMEVKGDDGISKVQMMNTAIEYFCFHPYTLYFCTIATRRQFLT